ncbi:unnamed protein product [Protopolystoma xenopodis]|uniref:Uncharacterized protein n=1 Tax=Protopolystoma xenopodis TaxID=117903 RepID=A0A448WA69_9PLAT|nr:unnamed protein product [Protopolystoma xenopodis]
MIQDIEVTETEILVSSEVQSMYTNITVENAVTALLEVLEREEDPPEAERIKKQLLTQLLYIFRQIYGQIFELTMRSSLTNLLANGLMDNLERNSEKLPPQQRLPDCQAPEVVLVYSKLTSLADNDFAGLPKTPAPTFFIAIPFPPVSGRSLIQASPFRWSCSILVSPEFAYAVSKDIASSTSIVN